MTDELDLVQWANHPMSQSAVAAYEEALARAEAAEAELASGSFYKESDIDALQDKIATLSARLAEVEAALRDLLSWFPDKPSPPEWRLVAGDLGADDAVAFARAALSTDAKEGRE